MAISAHSSWSRNPSVRSFVKMLDHTPPLRGDMTSYFLIWQCAGSEGRHGWCGRNFKMAVTGSMLSMEEILGFAVGNEINYTDYHHRSQLDTYFYTGHIIICKRQWTNELSLHTGHNIIQMAIDLCIIITYQLHPLYNHRWHWSHHQLHNNATQLCTDRAFLLEISSKE